MKLVVSAHLLLFLNGRLFGQATSVRWKISTPRARRHGIDEIRSSELSPTTVALSGMVTCIKVHADGGLEGRGVVAPDVVIPKEQYFDLLIVDRATGRKVLSAAYCAVTEQSWEAASKGRLDGSFNFEGLTYSPELDYG